MKTKVEESIKDLIEDSQYGFQIDINNALYDVAILSTKTTQEYEAANIIAPLSVPLDKGTIFDWDGNNWILLKKMFRPDQPGFNGIAYRCNGILKWIDKEGKLREQPAYVRSGRITNALGVTPDVYHIADNIIYRDSDWNMMAATVQPSPLDEFHREMRFIIKGQAYRVSNIDNVSIDNVSIISFEDDKLLDTDDLINGIAYNDDYPYTIESAVKGDTKLYIDDVMKLPINILYNGMFTEDEDYILESSNPEVVEVTGKQIIGRAEGEAYITAILGRNHTIKTEPIKVIIVENHEIIEPKIFIEGNDYIEWNSEETYRLSNGDDASFEVEVMSKVRKEITFGPDSVTIAIEDKYSGTIEISCDTSQGRITKTVYIRTV